jgi:Holliday junction resolvase RusA-like endonuclease
MYDPPKSRDYKSYVRMMAAQAYKGPLLEGALSLKVVVYRTPPSSWSKMKTALALSGKIRPTPKPDLTNTIKGIEDALNGLIWKDDAQVVDLVLGKWYADTPRAEIEICEIPS